MDLPHVYYLEIYIVYLFFLPSSSSKVWQKATSKSYIFVKISKTLSWRCVFEVDSSPVKTTAFGMCSWRESSFIAQMQMQKMNKREA